MAEVLLARVEGPHEFSKQVVLKRIRPELASDPKFVQMFLQEARLAAQLNHPNIVQVFDFGEQEGTYFLAMEYLAGADARECLRHFKALGQSFPVALACKIVLDVADGLHYAHQLTSPEGEPLGVVHRDVTPDNILLSEQGIPKLVDFGIARGANRGFETTAGGIKGKFAYLAPELVNHETVDHQADVYGLGATLYELLTGHKVYEGENDLQILGLIVQGSMKPPSSWVPTLPPELNSIVMKALARSKTVRYASAGELRDALAGFVATLPGRANAQDLIALTKEVRQRTPRKLFEAFVSRPPLPVRTPAPSVPPAPPRPPAVVTPARPAVSGWVAALLVSGLLGLAAATFFALRPGQQVPAEKAQAPEASRTTPLPSATGASPTSVPGPAATPKPTPSPAAPVAVAPTTSNAAVPPEAPSHPSGTTRSPGRASTTVKEPVRHGPGFLTVRASPWCNVTVDGEAAGSTPLARIPLASGSHRVVLTNPEEGAQRELQVRIEAGKETVKAVVFKPSELRGGQTARRAAHED
jgi:serine/threonine-protein kinase